MYTVGMAILIIAFGLLIYAKLSAVEQRIKQQEKLLKRLAKNEAIETPVPDDVLKLIRADEDIKAIKAVREHFGYSLVEAKEYVEKVKLSK